MKYVTFTLPNHLLAPFLLEQSCHHGVENVDLMDILWSLMAFIENSKFAGIYTLYHVSINRITTTDIVFKYLHNVC